MGPSMETWSSRYRVQLCYIIFLKCAEDRPQWHGQETLTRGRAHLTDLTSVTVSVSDDEVHLLILRDFVHTLVKMSNMVHHGFCPPAFS